MKYLIILGDGMADEPIPSLGRRTPLQAARKPDIDRLAALDDGERAARRTERDKRLDSARNYHATKRQ